MEKSLESAINSEARMLYSKEGYEEIIPYLNEDVFKKYRKME